MTAGRGFRSDIAFRPRWSSCHATGKAELAIRPNSIHIQAPAPGLLSGRIRTSCYLGDHIEYEIETEQGVLFAVDTAVERQLSHGCDVGIGLAPRGVALIAASS
ncbi:TOBE domain-containing protein [Neotabrizicola sp. VNH66]|uniref:TOBE domain-containing protein n=1 Tax=Neotabrizicola sp. VNH66 TaxID=3400918 RepID=UPI003C09B66E